jgi:hypothetical protein
MPYPTVFKRVAEHTPVLRTVVAERDALRRRVLEMQAAHEALARDRDATAALRDALAGEAAALAGEAAALRRALEEAGAERDAVRRATGWLGPDRNAGWCPVCRADASFRVAGPWLRDDYLCEGCGSIPRQRHLQLVLDSAFPGWDELEVHESSPSNDYLARRCARYGASQYLPDVAPGTVHDGVRCENLESLSFADASLDLFVTQDVFEHVLRPDVAAREVMRVLRPGGAHVFTVPKHRGLRCSRPRVELVDGAARPLMDEVFHGNPVGDGRVLVTWDYGDDLESLFAGWCGAPTVGHVTRDRRLGIDGEFLEVFVTRKPAPAPAAGAAVTAPRST